MSPQSTQAAVLFETSKPLQLCTLQLPDLKPGQVLVKIAYSGICHSQLNEIRGLKGPDKNLPHTLGHEASGIVEDIGSGVTKVKVADSVVLSWIKGKGMDVPSTIYASSNGKKINSGAISTFMNYAIVSENRVVPISRMVPFREAVLLGCAIPTGAGIIFNTAKVQSGSSVAIFGVGGIGMSAILAAKIAGASTIIAMDVVEQKLELARKVGATHAIVAQAAQFEQIMKITNNKGVDYAIEASGKREAMETAFKIVKDQGGLCVLAGNLPHQEKISIDPFDLIKGKRIIGTWGGETQPDHDIPLYADLYLKGKLKLDDLITHEYPLEKINEAFTDLEKGKVGRALIRMEESQ